MVGPVNRHSPKSCALLPTNASNAADDSTIPRQPTLVLKIRVLDQYCHQLLKSGDQQTGCYRGAMFKRRASPPKQMQAREHETVHKFQGRMQVTINVRQLHIYVPAVFPAKLPGETTAHFRIMYSSSNTKCNHFHSRSLCPLSRSSIQTSAQYY